MGGSGTGPLGFQRVQESATMKARARVARIRPKGGGGGAMTYMREVWGGFEKCEYPACDLHKGQGLGATYKGGQRESLNVRHKSLVWLRATSNPPV